MRIEQRLKMLADENPNYSLLWAQWEFDKKLLSRALNTVSRDFPHYSLHDASHSSTIITQIEKVIAPNIEKLSATDCWLLLESCYWHDAGMIITHEDKATLVNDKDFLRHLDNLSKSNGELSDYARYVLEEKNRNDINKALLISNSLTFLVADHFRTLHASRSGEYVYEPTKINVNSPRTSLMPRRLFDFVAKIVECHGKSRSEILNLPHQNDGMDANDYAHPRYIAALLRIGDLLDIDDGRFCSTLLTNIGEVPASSHTHQRKHASLKHFLINSDVIDIQAVCNDYDSFQAQAAWFKYIKDEFDYQKRVWNKIVPNTTFKALPTIENVDCEIEGYIAFNGGAPRISLDTSRIYNYITGALLYSEKYPFVREIVQNAIDATYYQLWDDLKYSDSIENMESSKQREIFDNALKNEKIIVSLMQFKPQIQDRLLHKNSNDYIYYEFVVKDFGTGMSLSDLKKLLNVGSDSTEERKNARWEMPDWAKPSGFFGIGLQTVITSCEKIIIKTKKTDNDYYILEINKSEKNETIFSLRTEKDHRFKGTEVRAVFCELTIPLSVSVEAFDILGKFDPLTESILEVVPEYIHNALMQNFSLNNMSLVFNGKSINSEVSSNLDSVWSEDLDNSIDFNLHVKEDLSSELNFLYKDVGFESNLYFPGISGVVNIFSNNADFWLMMDRKKGRSDKKKELRTLMDRVVRRNIKEIVSNSEDTPASHFYAYSLCHDLFFSKWGSYIIAGSTVNELIDGDKPLIISSNSISHREYKKYALCFNDNAFSCFASILKELKVSCNISFLFNEDYGDNRYRKNTDLFIVDFINDGLANLKFDQGAIDCLFSVENITERSRWILPCYVDKYKSISIHKMHLPAWVYNMNAYCAWTNHYIFTPNFKNEIEADLDIILKFYKKHRKLILMKNFLKKIIKNVGLNLNLFKY